MIVLADVLTSEELAYVQGELATAVFEEGKLTARGTAQSVKNNEQLQRSHETATRLDAVLWNRPACDTRRYSGFKA